MEEIIEQKELKSNPALQDLRDMMGYIINQNDAKEGERVMLLYYTDPKELMDYAKKIYKDDKWWDNSIDGFQMIPGNNFRQTKEFMRNKLGEILSNFSS